MLRWQRTAVLRACCSGHARCLTADGKRRPSAAVVFGKRAGWAGQPFAAPGIFSAQHNPGRREEGGAMRAVSDWQRRGGTAVLRACCSGHARCLTADGKRRPSAAVVFGKRAGWAGQPFAAPGIFSAQHNPGRREEGGAMRAVSDWQRRGGTAVLRACCSGHARCLTAGLQQTHSGHTLPHRGRRRARSKRCESIRRKGSLCSPLAAVPISACGRCWTHWSSAARGQRSFRGGLQRSGREDMPRRALSRGCKIGSRPYDHRDYRGLGAAAPRHRLVGQHAGLTDPKSIRWIYGLCERSGERQRGAAP